MIELVNAATGTGGLMRDQAARFVTVLSPFAPHVAEELWEKLGNAPFVSRAPWPSWDDAMLVDATIQVPVQVNGPVRARIDVPAAASAADLEKTALADPRVQELTAGKTIRKVIVVPGKLVNVVVG
jgi:leucyl-tRNA synthetase